MANGKISGDPTATTAVGVYMAAIQGGANVQAPSTLFAANQFNLSDLTNPGQALLNLGGLSSALAATTYLTQVDAASTYLTIAAAGAGYQAYVATRTAMKALDTTKGTICYLTEALRQGVFVWTTGNFSTQITADTQEGVYVKADAIASTAGAWVRVHQGVMNALWFGALGDNSHDDQPNFTAAYTIAKLIGTATTEGPCGFVWGPPGYRYKFGGSLLLDVPVKLKIEGEIFYTPTTGAAVVVGSTLHTARGNTQYDIDLGVIRAVNGNLVAPTGINTSGSIGVELRDVQFSNIRVAFTIAFTYAGIYANSSNNVFTGQHIQDNWIYHGEAAYCGVGFLAESFSGAQGAFQVNEVHIQNSFGNWCNIVLGKSGDGNTNNNLFYVAAADADTGGGNTILWSSYNYVQFGYISGVITLQASTFYNKIYYQVGKAQCTVTDSGTGNLVQNNVEGTLTQDRWETTGLLPMQVIQSKDAGAAVADLVEYYRNSATPAANDAGVGVRWAFNNDAAAKFTGSRIRAAAVAVTAGTEHSRLIFSNRLAGVETDVASLWQGLSIGAAAADQGAGTINVVTSYSLAGTAVINSTGIIVPTGKVAVPQTNDGAALGTTALQWSDLFLATGAVVNFNNGNYTITHSAGTLTLSGALVSGNLAVTSSTIPANGVYLGAANTLTFAANTTGLINLSTSAFRPLSAGLLTLGSSANPWGDTFVKSTGKIDFGSGDYTITHSAGALTFSGGFVVSGGIITTGFVGSNGATAGVGYSTGAGGTVTQLTSRTTGVTLNKASGAITMFNAAGSATAATFTVTNSAVATTDTITLNQKSGTNLYNFIVTAVAAGSFNITFYTTGGTSADAPVINFNVIKGVAA